MESPLDFSSGGFWRFSCGGKVGCERVEVCGEEMVEALYCRKHRCGGAAFGGRDMALQERLSLYLDVVELNLVKEIELRSSLFYEAQGQLEDLKGKINEWCGWVRELKENIRLLDENFVGSARKVQKLSVKRGDLVGLHNKLRLNLSVNQALYMLLIGFDMPDGGVNKELGVGVAWVVNMLNKEQDGSESLEACLSVGC